jgi:hypothetical protein
MSKRTWFLQRQNNSAEHWSLCSYNRKLTNLSLREARFIDRNLQVTKRKQFIHLQSRSLNMYWTSELLPKLYLEIVVLPSRKIFTKAFSGAFNSHFNYGYFSYFSIRGYPSACGHIPSISDFEVNPSVFMKCIVVVEIFGFLRSMFLNLVP